MNWKAGFSLWRPFRKGGAAERRALAAHWERVLRGVRLSRQVAGTRSDAPRVLMATCTGGHPVVARVETLLAAALAVRGARVDFLLCDKFLDSCWQGVSTRFGDVSDFVRDGLRSTLCRKCYDKGADVYRAVGLPVHRLGGLVSAAELREAGEVAEAVAFEDIPSYRFQGLAVGQHALAGALRFFARGTLEAEPLGEPVLRRYLHAGLLTAYGVARLFEREGYDSAVFNHGIYIPHGVIGEVARDRGVHVVNWIQAYRKRCFIFSHGDTYHHTMISEPVDTWENLEIGPETESRFFEYLRSRWEGTNDWIRFHEDSLTDADEIFRMLGMDPEKPRVGLLTNVVWDAQLHYPANVFGNMIEWVLETIHYFSARPELQLVIRVHPAERTGLIPTRQPIVDEIASRFPELPPNVFVIPPESEISTYATMATCDSVVIYGTKTGVELSCMGIPVIVAGEAWIRGKGITTDAGSVAEYFAILDSLPLGRRLDPETRARALRYAYHFFFRRMIPLEFFEPRDGWPPFDLALESVEELDEGKSVALDVVCDGILRGADFVYPAERLGTVCTDGTGRAAV